MTEERWVPTTAEVYRAVYKQHGEEFQVFATHTCMYGCYFHSEPHVMTTWGFPDAGFAIIKSEGVGEYEDRKWNYWIALVPGAKHEDC